MYFINQQVENSYWEGGKYCNLSQNQSKVSIRKRENLEHLLFFIIDCKILFFKAWKDCHGGGGLQTINTLAEKL